MYWARTGSWWMHDRSQPSTDRSRRLHAQGLRPNPTTSRGGREEKPANGQTQAGTCRCPGQPLHTPPAVGGRRPPKRCPSEATSGGWETWGSCPSRSHARHTYWGEDFSVTLCRLTRPTIDSSACCSIQTLPCFRGPGGARSAVVGRLVLPAMYAPSPCRKQTVEVVLGIAKFWVPCDVT